MSNSGPAGDGADDDEATLSIGDLAEETGVSAANLRIWESRHGFPVPHRLTSGHRRYDAGHVAAVRDVVRRREDGVRLDVAIEQTVAASLAPVLPPLPSVFGRLRRMHPDLAPHRLRKSTLLGLSWAIEDEFCSHAQRAHVFGAFQKQRNYDSAEARWVDLARTSTSTYVFADFPDAGGGTPRRVPLTADNPMSREWAVVCDGPELPVALAAWELPGQDAVRDRDRIFETLWTVEPGAVRNAARVCVDVAVEAGAPGAGDVARALAVPPGPGRADLAQVTALFNRVTAYVDTPPRRR